MPKKLINSFNAGELSPYLYARTDLDKYASGCLTMENFMPMPYGGATRRPGLEYIGASKADDKIRLIPFTASVDASYVLEFGSEYIRFWKNGAVVETTEAAWVAPVASYITISMVGSSGGTFTVTVNGVETATIAYNASAAAVVTAIGLIGYTVTVDLTATVYTITFGDDAELVLLPSLETDITQLTGGTPTSVATAGTLTEYAIGSLVTTGGFAYRCIIAHNASTFSVDLAALKWELRGSTDLAFEIISPYADTDLAEIKVAQSIDVMWIAHPDFPIQRLSRIANDSWTLVDEEFDFPPTLERNVSDVTLAPSATTGLGIDITASESFFNAGHVGAYFSIEHPRSEGGAWEGSLSGTSTSPEIDVSGNFWSGGWQYNFIGGTALLQIKVGAGAWTTVASGTSFTYNSPVAAAATTLVRISLGSGNGSGYIYEDSGSSINGSTTTSYTSGALNISLNDWSVTTGGTGWKGRVIIQKSSDGALWEDYIIIGDTSGIDSKNFSFSSDEPEIASTFIRLKYSANNASEFTFNLRSDDVYTIGLVKIISYTSPTFVTADVISDLSDTNAVLTWTEGAFSDYRGHPQSVAIFENRLCYAGTATNQDTIWMSKLDDYTDFILGSLDTDALKLTIGSGPLNEIKWMVPQEVLVIGTSGGEWTLGPVADNQPITPTGFNLKRKSAYGTSGVQGFLINNSILFPMRQGRKVREWIYQYSSTTDPSADLTLLAEHITKGGIVQWDYQQQPDSVLWSIRGDGTLLGFTYERDQSVVGWHRHNNSAFIFESVAVIPKLSEEDEVWVSVKVTINSVVKRYIARLQDREWGTNHTTEWAGSDLYSVKSGAATVSGLDYLEGKTVSVVADGVPLADDVVTSGDLAVDYTAYTRLVIGLPFTATIAPIYPEIDYTGGNTMGGQRNIRRAIVRFKDTYSAQVGQGTTAALLEDVRFEQDDSPLYNAEREVEFDNSSDFLHTCYIVQSEQMPCTLIALIPTVEARR